MPFRSQRNTIPSKYLGYVCVAHLWVGVWGTGDLRRGFCVKDRELEDHDDGNCKVDKDCKPGHVCRPVGFSYQKECRKYQGICGFWGGKRCEPDEICIQDIAKRTLILNNRLMDAM